MFNLLVTFRCFPGKRESFVERVRAEGVLEAVRNEDGCHRYDYFFSEEDKDLILLVEAWETAEHQKVHIDQPHMDLLRSFKGEYIADTKIEVYNLV